MPCCQGKRRAFYNNPPSIEPPPQRSAAMPPVPFEYIGATALTATGAITGRRYRFDRSGAVTEVDARDAPSLAGVPQLRVRRK
jgi:hypothetical protein